MVHNSCSDPELNIDFLSSRRNFQTDKILIVGSKFEMQTKFIIYTNKCPRMKSWRSSVCWTSTKQMTCNILQTAKTPKKNGHSFLLLKCALTYGHQTGFWIYNDFAPSPRSSKLSFRRVEIGADFSYTEIANDLRPSSEISGSEASHS